MEMNIQIQKLLDQATYNVLGVKQIDQKQFAELIVKECAGIYSKIDNGNLHMGTDDYLEALHKTFWS
jgi:hypothetical protein